jgi:hypothetical protein
VEEPSDGWSVCGMKYESAADGGSQAPELHLENGERCVETDIYALGMVSIMIDKICSQSTHLETISFAPDNVGQ